MKRSYQRQCVALIGDIVHSRRLQSSRRYSIQNKLLRFLNEFSDDHAPDIVSRFVLTLGDEFQGLVKAPQIIPDLLWRLESQELGVQVRIGVGYGTLTTPVREEAIGMDGPAFHNARTAITEAKALGHLGGVFSGFGTPATEVLNGFARILQLKRASWTHTQREVVYLLRKGWKQSGISEELDITQQAVSSRVRSSGWDAYAEAERGWTLMLAQFDRTPDWERA
jgi:hypothetical protein